MRPVDLMPPDERRGSSRAPMRAGGASYVLLAALGLGLLLVIATALTSKQISDRASEKEQLEQELAAVTAKANSLRAFSDFREMQQNRTDTISSLAQSRFDWERVMQEFSKVIPPDVWLVNMTGTVNPAVDVEESADIPIRDTVAGPAIELVGCVPSEDSLAGFIAALEDIDGVTRVGLASSEQPDEGQDQPQQDPTLSGSDAGDECRTRDFISRFEIVVAFDAVPVPPTATASPSVPAPLAPQGEGPELTAQQQAEDADDSTGAQVSEAQDAANIVPGG